MTARKGQVRLRGGRRRDSLTVTRDIRPEVGVALSRHAAAQGRDLEGRAARLLEVLRDPSFARAVDFE